MNDESLDAQVATAGEYALGLLSADEARKFENDMSSKPALRQLVNDWNEQFARMATRLPSGEVPPHIWTEICRQLKSQAKTQAPSTEMRVQAGRVSVWWKHFGVAASMAVVALSVILFQALGLQTDGPRYMAVLKSPDDQSQWLVEGRPGQTVALYQIGALPVKAEETKGKSLQFWTKPRGASGPTSLGLVELGKPLVLPVSMLPAMEGEQLFEVTLEPPEGSPYDKPTGPILFVGRTVALKE